MIKKISGLLIISTLILAQFSAALAQEPPAPENTTEVTPELAAEVLGQPLPNEGFTITPANPNTINPRKFIFELKPGDQANDYVEIRNLSPTEQTFLLYGADPTFSAQGTPAYKTRQAGISAEGAWVKFEEPEVKLGPDETKIAKFTITAPHEAAGGDYRAGIAMEKSKKDVNNPGITIATRIILHAEIKVTDSPNAIPKQDGTYKNGTHTDHPPENQWKVVYFWISLVLFIASFIALIWVTLQERKQKTIAPAPVALTKKKTVKKRKTTTKAKSTKTKAKKSTAKKTVRKTAAKKKPVRKTTARKPAKKTSRKKSTKK